MQSIFGGGESLTSDLTFCMKGRECNNTPSQQNICCSLSIPSFVFIYYYFIYVSREILMKGTKKPRMFVFIYACGVCVSVYVCIIYIWVCGDRFCMALVAGLFVLLLHSGCCTVGLHCCWHGIRGEFCDGLNLNWMCSPAYIFVYLLYDPCTLWIWQGVVEGCSRVGGSSSPSDTVIWTVEGCR